MDEYAFSSFGQWLKQRRRALDLTRRELAQRVGCAVVTLRKIEAGTRRPSKQIAELLAEQLDIPAEQRAAFLRFARGASDVPPSVFIPVPTPRVETLPQHIFPPLPSTHLPTPLTRLIGRERELAQLQIWLADPEIRLITLTGPPGIGKTRLALEIARVTRVPFEGIFLIPLAQISDAKLLLPALGAALRVRPRSDQPMAERLMEFLRDRHVLLLLDNCEQIITAAPQLVTLLEACARLKMIVTSRHALCVRGEQQFVVPPLALPERTRAISPEELARNPAVALFVARGRAVQPMLTWTDANARAVIEICHRLEGIPLSLELAAARLATLSPPELRDQLRSRLQVLNGGLRDLPAHQSSLRAALEWSFQLLTAEEQRAFRRLAVFAGGFTQAMAQAVAQVTPAEIHSLVRQSLLEAYGRTNDASRFLMLETLREYALERLRQAREQATFRARHLNYFVAWVEGLEPKLRGGEQLRWLQELETERDNLRAALEWGQTDKRAVGQGLRLAGALRWFWDVRNYHAEGLTRLERLLARAEAQAPAYAAARAKALNAAAFLYAVQGNSATAQQLAGQALALAATQDDHLNRAWALHILAREMLSAENFSQAYDLATQALALWRALHDDWGIADALNTLGEIAFLQGAPARAQMHYEEAMLLLQQLQDRDVLAFTLRRLAQIALRQHALTRAQELAQASLELNRQVGSQRGIAACLATRAAILLASQADATHARLEAARLLGAAAKYLAASSAHFAKIDQLEYDAAVERVRAVAHPEAFAAAFAKDQDLDFVIEST